MDDSIYFNEQHLATRELVRRFAREEVAPVAAKHDADATFPWDNIKAMGELGLLGAPWSEELGGAGLDLLSYLIIIHELAKVDASHGLTVSAHTTLGTSPIVNFGTDAQKRRYVPLLASGRVMGGFGLTEPDAGSDAGGTKTMAVRKGDRYILNGRKRFITHGSVGEIFVVTAVTDRAAGTRGISSFILTKPTNDLAAAERVGVGHDASLPAMAGFKAGKKEDKLGWRASDTAELIMDDVEVPAENLLGQEGLGFVNFMKTLDSGRIGIAALSSVRRCTTRPAGSSSDSPSRSSRACSSSSPTWPLESRRDIISSSTPPSWPRRENPSPSRRRWPSCSARSSPCGPRPRRSSSTAATATPRTIPSSGSCATPRSARSAKERARFSGS